MPDINARRAYKVALIGDGGVGKTAFIKRFDGSFEENYVPTIGVDVYTIIVGGIPFNVWDCAGQEKFSGLRGGYYIQSDCAIIMSDNRTTSTRNAVDKWLREFKRVIDHDVPIEFVTNKCDIGTHDEGLNISAKYNTRTELEQVFRNLIVKLGIA